MTGDYDALDSAAIIPYQELLGNYDQGLRSYQGI